MRSLRLCLNNYSAQHGVKRSFMPVSISAALVYLARLSNRWKRVNITLFACKGLFLSRIWWECTFFQTSNEGLSYFNQIIRWIWCYFDGIFLKTKPTSNDAMLFVNCGDWKRGRNVLEKKQITVAVRFSISRHTGSMRLNFVEQLTQLASVCDLPAISKPLLFTHNKYFFNKSTSTLSVWMLNSCLADVGTIKYMNYTNSDN